MDTPSLSRRDFLASTAAALAAGLAGPGCGSQAAQQQPGVTAPPAPRGTRVLLKGGCVLSLDPKVGDFDVADVLIDGSRIAEVRPNITAQAEVIDAAKGSELRYIHHNGRLLWRLREHGKKGKHLSH